MHQSSAIAAMWGRGDPKFYVWHVVLQQNREFVLLHPSMTPFWSRLLWMKLNTPFQKPKQL